MKKVIFTSLISLAMAFAPGAFAQTNDTGVVNSGDNVNISSSASQNSNVSVTNNNTAEVIQTVVANAETGHNQANRNIGATSVTTGNAAIGAGLSADVNRNATAISSLNANTSNTTSVVNTGNNLNTNTNANTNNSVNVNNTNTAKVGQIVVAHAETGDNHADRNIGRTSVTTGNAAIGVEEEALLNRNATFIGETSGLGGDPSNVTDIVNTGDNDRVDTSASANSDIRVNNNNIAKTMQIVVAKAETGHNQANRNIGGASISTGNALIGAGLSTTANANLTDIDNPFLSEPESNFISVVNTGNNLNANANVSSNSTENVNNSNTLKMLQTGIFCDSSGYNHADSNIDGSHVTTGSALTEVGFVVHGNLNASYIGNDLGFLFEL